MGQALKEGERNPFREVRVERPEGGNGAKKSSKRKGHESQKPANLRSLQRQWEDASWRYLVTGSIKRSGLPLQPRHHQFETHDGRVLTGQHDAFRLKREKPTPTGKQIKHQRQIYKEVFTELGIRDSDAHLEKQMATARKIGRDISRFATAELKIEYEFKKRKEFKRFQSSLKRSSRRFGSNSQREPMPHVRKSTGTPEASSVFMINPDEVKGASQDSSRKDAGNEMTYQFGNKGERRAYTQDAQREAVSSTLRQRLYERYRIDGNRLAQRQFDRAFNDELGNLVTAQQIALFKLSKSPELKAQTQNEQDSIPEISRGSAMVVYQAHETGELPTQRGENGNTDPMIPVYQIPKPVQEPRVLH